MVGANEASRETIGRSKVTWRVEWASSHGWAAVAIEAVDYTADFEISPSCGIASGTSSGCSGFEEVCLVEGCHIYNAGQEHEECE